MKIQMVLAETILILTLAVGVFELNYSISEFERARKADIKCSTCGSSRVIQQVPVFQVQTAKKS